MENYESNDCESLSEYARRVEQLMRNAPRYVREAFARLGCSLCSAKGYVSSEERRVILSWV